MVGDAGRIPLPSASRQRPQSRRDDRAGHTELRTRLCDGGSSSAWRRAVSHRRCLSSKVVRRRDAQPTGTAGTEIADRWCAALLLHRPEVAKRVDTFSIRSLGSAGMADVTLRRVDAELFAAVVALRVTEERAGWVASNLKSLEQAATDPALRAAGGAPLADTARPLRLPPWWSRDGSWNSARWPATSKSRSGRTWRVLTEARSA